MQFAIFLRPDRAARGSVLLFIPCSCLARMATTSDWFLLEVEPGSPAAQASLMAGDILLGTEEKPFQSIDDLAKAMDGQGLCLLRLEFLRGNYSRVRRVTVQLGVSNNGKTESPRDSRFYRRSFAADSRGPAEHVGG